MQDELSIIVEQNRSPRLAVGAKSRLEEILGEHNNVAHGAFSSGYLK